MAVAEGGLRPKPDWTTGGKVPRGDGYRYFVGVATDQASREEALRTAWLNALSDIAKSQFPELLTVSEQSKETLTSATYERIAVTALERVSWTGLEEVSGQSSPYYDVREQGDHEVVTAFRLLRWRVADIEKERARLAAASRTDAEPTTEYSSTVGHSGGPVGSLSITSSPPGATILLDGHSTGQTNAVFHRVGSGTYQLVIQLDGYEPWEQPVEIVPARTMGVRAELRKVRGMVTVTSEPPGATIYVDNMPTSTRTPATIEKPLGSYTVRAELPGYFPDARIANISYRPEAVAFSLKPKPGFLSVLATPPDATIYVDGKPAGSHVLNKLLDGGHYTVTAKKAGFADQTQDVDIDEAHGRTLTFNLVSGGASESGKTSSNSKAASQSARKAYSSRAVVWGLAGAAATVGAVLSAQQANQSYAQYQSATTASAASGKRSDTIMYDDAAVGLGLIGLTSLAICGYNAYEAGHYLAVNTPKSPEVFADVFVRPGAHGISLGFATVIP